MIGGSSQSWNRLRNPKYILKKIWYIQSLGYRDPYIIIYGSFVPLGTHEKVIGGSSPLRMNSGTLDTFFKRIGTLLTKFGTALLKFGISNPRATNIPILVPMIRLFL